MTSKYSVCTMKVQEEVKKGKLAMIRKIVLILIMGLVFVGAASTATSFPVLLAMGCLILWALSVALRSEQQG